MIELLLNLIPALAGVIGVIFASYKHNEARIAKQEAKEARYESSREKLHREIAEKMRDEIYTANEHATKATKDAVEKAKSDKSHFSS